MKAHRQWRDKVVLPSRGSTTCAERSVEQPRATALHLGEDRPTIGEHSVGLVDSPHTRCRSGHDGVIGPLPLPFCLCLHSGISTRSR